MEEVVFNVLYYWGYQLSTCWALLNTFFILMLVKKANDMFFNAVFEKMLWKSETIEMNKKLENTCEEVFLIKIASF